MVAVLWLAVATQVVVNRVFKEEFKITEAFVKINTEEMQSNIEVMAEYKADFLSENEKKDFIKYFANAIGLTIDREITVLKEGNRSEYSFCKMAKRATSEIKVISKEQEENSVIQMKHYFIIKLTILDGITSMDRYRNLIEDALKDVGIDNKQITLQYEGNYEGILDLEEKSNIATLLVDELKGEIAVEYDEGDLYSVYAYTGMLNEYIVSMDSKINIHIAMTYNELTNKTKIYLATPILNESW